MSEEEAPRSIDVSGRTTSTGGVDAQRAQGLQVVLGGAAGPTIQINTFGPVTLGDAPAQTAADPISVVVTGECPYPGMTTFETADARFYFGRTHLITELAERAATVYRTGGLLFVVGASGCGKSSLLRAGLIPAFEAGNVAVPRSQRWPRLLMTPGPRPIEALCTGIAAMARLPAGDVVDALVTHPDRFDLLVRQAVLAHGAAESDTRRPPRRMLVIVDQFEEVFSPAVDAQARQDFVQALVSAAAPRVPPSQVGPAQPDVDASALVVVGLRADFFAQCLTEPLLRPLLQNHQVLVGPLTEKEIRAAVEEPARRAGLRLEPGLTDLILTDLDVRVAARSGPTLPDGADTSTRRPFLPAETGWLPFLAHALRETWERREGDTLTITGYRAAGGIHGSVAATAERLYETLDDDHRDVLRQMMLRLVTVTDDSLPTRRYVTRTELLSEGDTTTTTAVRRELDDLVASRLITATDLWVQISHEALIEGWPRLTDWLDADRAGLYLHRQLTDAARQWDRGARDDALLYRGSRLQDALTWARHAEHRRDLNPLEEAFLHASRHADRRRARRTRVAAIALVTLLVAALAATGTAVNYAASADRQRADARRQRGTAVSRLLAAQSQALATSDTYTAMLLASAALRVADTADARFSARNLLASPWTAVAGHTGSRASQVAFSPNQPILAVTAGPSILLWDTSTRRSLGSLSTGTTDDTASVAFSPDGKNLAAASGETILLWDVATRRRLDPPLTGHTGDIFSLAFDRYGHTLASAGDDHTVRLWDVTSHHQLGAPLLGHNDQVYDVAFSPTSDVLASAGGVEDSTARIWDVATHRELGLPLRDKGLDAVAFSPDGRMLATGNSYDGTVRLWSMATHQPEGEPLTGHTGATVDLAFSPDGTTLVR